ncbi:MAG: hypothetical protein AAB350_02820 [Patescibacteria group bacterium]
MSTFSIGQMNQLGDAFEAAGWNANLVTKLGQSGLLSLIRDFMEGRAEIVMKKVEEVVQSLLALVKVISTPAVAGKKTSDCFTDKSRYYYRDSNLDAWLPEDQPEQTESKFSVQKLTQNDTFKQVAESFLNLDQGDIATLAQLLKERGCVTTLPTIDLLIERQEAGEDVGFRTDGWANFFFVENKDGSVSVVNADRYDGQWLAYVSRLDDDNVWDAGHRFFFRNQTL